MPGLDLTTPRGAEESLEFYKNQIRELEADLADFQASSRELEAELEKELESSERQHRDLRSKNESLRYEVEEWKGKYKQSKTEANTAQNALQKEITALRDQNRALQLKLRDIEVANDDFEKQERIVKSSLDDLEQKYNQAIERGVLQDEEIKIGEQEREMLRIECQRLKDELSDLKVEQEITIEKLNNATALAAKYGHGSLHHVPPPTTFASPLSDASSVITDSPSTPMTTPSAVSTSTPQSDHSSPPSPPISEASTTPSQSARITEPLTDPATTPRPRHYRKAPRKHSRGPSLGNGSALPMPASRSLNQIRGLIGQMQRLEQRVQSARSKLPGPVNTPPRASPRNSSAMAGPQLPSGITMRSHRKSRPGSTASSVTSGGLDRERDLVSPFQHPARLSYSAMERPASVAERPPSRISRPSSRASTSGILQRPGSRASMSGRATPSLYGDYEGTPTPRRSVGGPGEDGFITPGFGSRRNTLNGRDSSIPLPTSSIPRRSVGGRRSGFTEEEGPLGGSVSMRRPGKKLAGVGEG